MANLSYCLVPAGAPYPVSVFANRANFGKDQGDEPRLHLLHRPKIPFTSLAINWEGVLKTGRTVGLNAWLDPTKVVSMSGQRHADIVKMASSDMHILCNDVLSADVIIIPRPAADDTERMNVFNAVVQQARPEAVIIQPVNDESVIRIFNFVFPFGVSTDIAKAEAVTACDSQVRRIRFDLAQRYTARAIAISHGLRSPDLYAERFRLELLFGNGSRSPSAIRSADQLPKKGKAVCASAHADDLVLGCGGFGMHLKRVFGWEIHDIVFTSGHRGILDPYAQARLLSGETLASAKLRIRRNELGASDHILGLDSWELLNLGFYDRPITEGPKKGQRQETPKEIAEVEAAILRKVGRTLDLAFVPLEGDLHPDHAKTREIMLPLLARIAENQGRPIILAGYASPWFTGDPAINALLYYQAPEEFIEKYPATYHAQMALAEAGRELASGLDPLAMSCFCEGPTARGHVMAEGYNIATAASLKEKFGK